MRSPGPTVSIVVENISAEYYHTPALGGHVERVLSMPSESAIGTCAQISQHKFLTRNLKSSDTIRQNLMTSTANSPQGLKLFKY